MQKKSNSCLLVVVVMLAFTACLPKEQVVFKSVKNLTVDTSTEGEPVLKGEAVFFNPNSIKATLKEINVGVLVDGKKAAMVDQKMDLLVPGRSDFSVPIEAKLDIKEFGLLDAVIGFFGGKTYQVQMAGYLRVNARGVTIKVPVKYSQEVKLNK
jgi:LEA14-like dessication related protein